MDIVLSNTSGQPIYAQIEEQVKAAITRGDLTEGDVLPSIRNLARDLRISVITTTRAYAELVNDGFVVNVPGKGYYVLPRDTELAREQTLRDVESCFADGIAKGRLANLPNDDLRAMFELALQEDR